MTRQLRTVALAVVVVALAACQPTATSSSTRATSPPRATATSPRPAAPPTTTTTPSPTVAVVGDSLVACCPDWTKPLGGRGPVDVWARSGATLSETLPHLRGLDWDPEVLVVAVGTNNAWGGWEHTDGRAQLEATLDAVDAECEVVVNIGAAPGLGGQPGVANVDIDEVAAERGVLVANWWGYSWYNSQWFGPDGVHHTAAGQAAYRATVANTVARCP